MVFNSWQNTRTFNKPANTNERKEEAEKALQVKIIQLLFYTSAYNDTSADITYWGCGSAGG